MNRSQTRAAAREGKRLIKRNPSVALLARQDAINAMCQGENNTDFHRALANVFIDLKEGKISQSRYDELTGKLLRE